MFNSVTVVLVISFYMAILFAIAQFVERRIEQSGKNFNGPWTYAISLAVYHTSWTFYGSVGFAAKSGLLFLGVYIGAILSIACWWFSLRRMVLAKNNFRVTSIADFISTRYNRSPLIAGLVTIIALLGVLPYIALQLKAVISSFQIITLTERDNLQSSAMEWGSSGLLITVFMIIFTIMFGLRRLDPTERHQGMISALMVECIIKLIAFISIGVFACFYLFSGFDDILTRLSRAGLDHVTSLHTRPDSGIMWLTLIILSFAAVQNLPRQFHVAVIENADVNHIKTAIWVFPLYIILINIFVVPIAGAGLLKGIDPAAADFYVLLLPQQADHAGLTMLAFIGGFSAATGMIIITTMTLSTMCSNHLIMPVIERFNSCAGIRSHLLKVRWLLVSGILLGSYSFAILFSDSYILVAIGLISFAAVLQFSPALLGGIFWHRGNSAGALAGLFCGFLIWGYTLVIPTLIKQGWLSEALLTEGLFKQLWLRPEALFGLENLSNIPHSVFWSMLFNIGAYVAGSLIYNPHKAERTLTAEFMAAVHNQAAHIARPTGLEQYIQLSDKIREANALLNNYLSEDKAETAIHRITEDLQVHDKDHISIIELIEFHRMLEHTLTGSIGAASAHNAMENSIRYTSREAADLKSLYSHLVTEMDTRLGNKTQSQEEDTNFGLIDELQRQINQLECKSLSQQQQIERLEMKLEERHQQIFKYRIAAQHAQRDKSLLSEQLKALQQESN